MYAMNDMTQEWMNYVITPYIRDMARQRIFEVFRQLDVLNASNE